MKYVDKVKEIAQNEATKLNLEIETVEWVFENNVNILRIIADKEEGLNIDDATSLNNQLSEILDKEDFIEEEYMLEVSSPGAEKELKSDKDIKKCISQYLHVEFVEKVNITKDAYIMEADGYLDSILENDKEEIEDILLNVNIKGRIKKLDIKKQNIKYIRKAIKF